MPQPYSPLSLAFTTKKPVPPAEATHGDSHEWQEELRDISDRLTTSCRAVDPASTDEVIQQAKAAADVVKGEAAEKTEMAPADVTPEPEAAFDAGLFD